MPSLKKIVRQTISLATSGAVTRGATLLAGILIARFYGPSVFGQYATVGALAGLFLSISNVGVNYRLMRESSVRAQSLSTSYGTSLAVTLLLIVLAYLALLIVGFVADYSRTTVKLIYVYGAAILVMGVQEVYTAIAQGTGRIGLISRYRAINGLWLLASVALAIVLEGNIVVFGILALIGAVVITGTWGLVTNRIVRPRFDWSHVPTLFKESYLYGLSFFFLLLYFRVDTVMLSVMKSEAVVGEYNAAYQFIELAVKAPYLISFVTMPIAFSAASDVNESEELHDKKIRYLSVMAVLIPLVLFWLAEPIVRYSVGGEYELAPAALQVLAIAMIPKVVAMAPGDTLTAMDRQATRVGIQGGAALLNIVVNLVLIPKFGLMGAAWATVGTELFVAVAYVLAVHEGHIGRGSTGRNLGKLAAVLLIVSGSSWLGWHIWNEYAAVALGGVLTAILVVGSGMVDPREILQEDK